ncbi:MAG: TIGR00282 family metallophosphoesterase [Kiritimatiellia bacterium]
MKILMVGDIVGAPGRACFKRVAKQLFGAGEIHAIIANAENCAAGNGITLALAQELFESGATLITLGDHTWGQKGFDAAIGSEKRIVRPANMPEDTPGATTAIAETALGPIAVISVLGQVFMGPADNPFHAVDRALKNIPANIPVFVDVHMEATSEKIAMGYWLDGRVAAVCGTHTHVQTSDAQLLPKGTAYLSDLGMTGPVNSVLGRCIEPVLKKFTTGIPARFEIAAGPTKLEGAIIEIPRGVLFPTAITSVRYRFDDE